MKIGLLDRLKIERCVLKGRLDGEWYELEEFDEPKKLSDIREIVDGYIEDGYDYFIFECFDKRGRKVKRLWSKKVRKREEEGWLVKVVKQLERYNEAREKLKELLGIREKGLEDLLAEVTYYENLKRLIVEKFAPILGVNPSGGGALKELKEFVEFIQLLRQMGINLGFAKRGTPAVPVQAPAATVATVAHNPQEGLAKQPTQIPKEVEEEAERIVKQLEEETSRELESKLCPRRLLEEGGGCPGEG